MGQEVSQDFGILAPELAQSQHLFQVPGGAPSVDLPTNAFEGFNRQLRKVTKAKSVFPTDDSLFQMLYLAMKDITRKWTGHRQDWSKTYAQIAIFYAERIPE